MHRGEQDAHQHQQPVPARGVPEQAGQSRFLQRGVVIVVVVHHGLPLPQVEGLVGQEPRRQAVGLGQRPRQQGAPLGRRPRVGRGRAPHVGQPAVQGVRAVRAVGGAGLVLVLVVGPAAAAATRAPAPGRPRPDVAVLAQREGRVAAPVQERRVGRRRGHGPRDPGRRATAAVVSLSVRSRACCCWPASLHADRKSVV